MNTWRLVTNNVDPEDALRRYLQDGFIALGWGLVGDLRVLRPSSASEIGEAIRRVAEYAPLNNSGQGGRCLWGFYDQMKIGDLVILSIGQGPLRHVIEVTGDYDYWNDRHVPAPPGDYYHCRVVKHRGDLDGRNLWTGPAPGWNRRWALVICR